MAPIYVPHPDTASVTIMNAALRVADPPKVEMIVE